MAVEPAITSPTTTNKTEARVLCAKAKKTVSRTIAWIMNAVRGESAAVSMGRKVEAALRFPQSGLIDGTTYLARALIPASANPRDTPAAMSVRKTARAFALAATTPPASARAAAVKIPNTSDTETTIPACSASG